MTEVLLCRVVSEIWEASGRGGLPTGVKGQCWFYLHDFTSPGGPVEEGRLYSPSVPTVHWSQLLFSEFVEPNQRVIEPLNGDSVPSPEETLWDLHFLSSSRHHTFDLNFFIMVWVPVSQFRSSGTVELQYERGSIALMLSSWIVTAAALGRPQGHCIVQPNDDYMTEESCRQTSPLCVCVFFQVFKTGWIQHQMNRNTWHFTVFL